MWALCLSAVLLQDGIEHLHDEALLRLGQCADAFELLLQLRWPARLNCVAADAGSRQGGSIGIEISSRRRGLTAARFKPTPQRYRDGYALIRCAHAHGPRRHTAACAPAPT